MISESLLISSLLAPLRKHMLNCEGLLIDSTCFLEAEPGKVNIERHKPEILFISLHAGSPFKLAHLA